MKIDRLIHRLPVRLPLVTQSTWSQSFEAAALYNIYVIYIHSWRGDLRGRVSSAHRGVQKLAVTWGPCSRRGGWGSSWVEYLGWGAWTAHVPKSHHRKQSFFWFNRLFVFHVHEHISERIEFCILRLHSLIHLLDEEMLDIDVIHVDEVPPCEMVLPIVDEIHADGVADLLIRTRILPESYTYNYIQYFYSTLFMNCTLV
jgi:hypothetical protein